MPRAGGAEAGFRGARLRAAGAGELCKASPTREGSPVSQHDEVGKLIAQALRPAVKWNSETAITYDKQRFLVVDDIAAARQNLRLCIQAMGGMAVDFAGNHSEALYRLRAGKTPSIILCDYNLGNGRNGQQFLEELRLEGIIPEETIFMMVTAERSYEQVVAAVELAPDDYIVKPFTPESLRVRLDRLVLKKIFFTRYYRAKREGDYARAIEILDELPSSPHANAHQFEIMRARAETLLQAGRHAETKADYESILAIRPFPWAKAGLARCLTAIEENQKARKLVDEVIEEAPHYLSALDLKASICTTMGDYAEAQQALEQAVARNPRNWKRQRNLSDAAVANGDMETARKAMDAVMKTATTPGALGPIDLVAMARLQLQQGDTAAAAKTLGQISADQIAKLPEMQRLSVLAVRAAFDPEAAAQFQADRPTLMGIERPTADLGIDVVSAALALEDEDLAVEFAERLLGNKETLKTFQPLLSAFNKAGLEDTLRRVQKDAAVKLIERKRQASAPAAQMMAANSA